MTNLRIGQGYDVHRLVPARPLYLGGVCIPYEMGLLGHSDADVLLHAVMDALLGAAGLGDIGLHFPDSDGAYRDISSLTLLARVAELLAGTGFVPVNLDVTLIAQAPKIAPYKAAMRHHIASALSMDEDCVSIKATTEEGLGFTGSGAGMAAQAVALVEKVR